MFLALVGLLFGIIIGIVLHSAWLTLGKTRVVNVIVGQNGEALSQDELENIQKQMESATNSSNFVGTGGKGILVKQIKVAR